MSNPVSESDSEINFVGQRPIQYNFVGQRPIQYNIIDTESNLVGPRQGFVSYDLESYSESNLVGPRLYQSAMALFEVPTGNPLSDLGNRKPIINLSSEKKTIELDSDSDSDS